MGGVNFLIAVVQRDMSDDYVKFFNENGANLVFTYMCEGTAQKKALNLWGLEKKERQLICALCGAAAANSILEGLVKVMRIDAPNAGIAFMTPVETVAGVANATRCGADFEKKVKEMEHSLVIAIAEKGHVDGVMDAARAAGARGGTVIHAKGTGAAYAAKFLGITIADEKEMIYLVVSKDTQEAIISAITDKNGSAAAAKAIAFTVPVEKIAGFSKL